MPDACLLGGTYSGSLSPDFRVQSALPQCRLMWIFPTAPTVPRGTKAVCTGCWCMVNGYRVMFAVNGICYRDNSYAAVCLCGDGHPGFPQQPDAFFQNVVLGVYVAVMQFPAFGALPYPDSEVFDFGVLIAAGGTGLAGREPAAHLDEMLALALQLIFQHPKELAPRRRRDFLRKFPVLYHPPDVQILTAECGAGVGYAAAQLMLEVLPLVCDLLLFRSNALFCLFPVLGTGMGFFVILLP